MARRQHLSDEQRKEREQYETERIARREQRRQELQKRLLTASGDICGATLDDNSLEQIALRMGFSYEQLAKYRPTVTGNRQPKHNTLNEVVRRETLAAKNPAALRNLPKHVPIKHKHAAPPPPINHVPKRLSTGKSEDEFRAELDLQTIADEIKSAKSLSDRRMESEIRQEYLGLKDRIAAAKRERQRVLRLLKKITPPPGAKVETFEQTIERINLNLERRIATDTICTLESLAKQFRKQHRELLEVQ